MGCLVGGVIGIFVGDAEGEKVGATLGTFDGVDVVVDDDGFTLGALVGTQTTKKNWLSRENTCIKKRKHSTKLTAARFTFLFV